MAKPILSISRPYITSMMDMLNSIPVTFTSALLAFSCSMICWGQSNSSDDATPADPRRNCLLIMVDGLRTDAVDTAPGEEPLARNISRFAKTGVHFTHARTPSSLNVQSVASLFSGRLPTLGGTIGLYEAEPHDGQPNLARAFEAAGYYTGIVSNQAAIGSYGFTRHFDDIQLATPQRPRSAEQLAQQAGQFVEDANSDPFFLYVYFGLPLPPAPDEVSYYAALAEVDAAIGQLLEGLLTNSGDAPPLVVLTAPNGFELSEHGDVGNGWTLNEEVLRVPLILHAPGILSPTTIDSPVSTQQLAPTLATLLDLGQTFSDAESLFERNDSAFAFTPPLEPLIAELVIPERVIMRSVTDGAWKYTVATRYTTPANRNVLARAHAATAQSYRDGSELPPPLWGNSAYEAIFNLTQDPNEKRNPIHEDAVPIDRLREVLRAYEEDCAKHAIPPRLSIQAVEELPTEDLEDLESLGYL